MFLPSQVKGIVQIKFVLNVFNYSIFLITLLSQLVIRPFFFSLIVKTCLIDFGNITGAKREKKVQNKITKHHSQVALKVKDAVLLDKAQRGD